MTGLGDALSNDGVETAGHKIEMIPKGLEEKKYTGHHLMTSFETQMDLSIDPS